MLSVLECHLKKKRTPKQLFTFLTILLYHLALPVSPVASVFLPLFITFSHSFYLLAVVPPLYHKLFCPICFRFLFPSSCCFFPFIQHFVQSFNSASSPTYGILLTSSPYWYTAGFQLPSIHFKWVGVHNLDTVQLHLFSCFLSPSSFFLRLISLLKDKRQLERNINPLNLFSGSFGKLNLRQRCYIIIFLLQLLSVCCLNGL